MPAKGRGNGKRVSHKRARSASNLSGRVWKQRNMRPDEWDDEEDQDEELPPEDPISCNL
jgi:hypothetical protein